MARKKSRPPGKSGANSADAHDLAVIKRRIGQPTTPWKTVRKQTTKETVEDALEMREVLKRQKAAKLIDGRDFLQRFGR